MEIELEMELEIEIKLEIKLEIEFYLSLCTLFGSFQFYKGKWTLPLANHGPFFNKSGKN